MDPKEQKKQGPLRKQQSPMLSTRDPSLSISGPSGTRRRSSTHHHTRVDIDREPTVPFRVKCCTFLYNKEEKTYCGRTCISWLLIIMYSIVYICFLAAYTMIFLFAGLMIIKQMDDYKGTEALTYSEHGIGISMAPSEPLQPLIWYRKGHSEDYKKYVKALDELLVRKRRKRDANLGPCGQAPYGYAGNTPCVVLRINKQFHWAGKPLELNSTEAKSAPVEVQNWMKKDKKLWLHCFGFHPYDREHVGRIRYYPHPPGFDPGLFPLGINNESPLIAMQISDFTLGLSLSVECKLWYANGPATVDFMLYVAPDDGTASNNTYG